MRGSRGKASITRVATLSALVVCFGWIFTISLGCRQESSVAQSGPGTAERGGKQTAESGREPTPGESSAQGEETGAITLENAGIRAHVLIPEGEAGSMGTYRVHVALPGGTQEIREDRDGVIAGAWLEDLNADGEVDLTVVMASAGSGSYPKIHFFRQEKQIFVLTPLSDLTEAQRAGYMGHDKVEVKDGKLLRTFPKYLSNDSNSAPSGGSVTLRYSFASNSWISE